MKNKRLGAFSSYHPIINFTYFLFVITFTMFIMHPILLGISLVTGLIYSIRLKGKKAIKFFVIFILPSIILITIINPLLIHQGGTILLYINEVPLTLEAIVFGGVSALMFAGTIIWFSCYNEIMTSDKFIYIFGRIIPSASLIISMVFRFVPKFRAQIKNISNGQKCIGRDISNGNIFQKITNGLNILSILVTWALENAIDTADSMKSRGYGLKGRSSYSIYKLNNKDIKALIGLISLISVVIIGVIIGQSTVYYYPFILMKEVTPFSIVIFVAYLLLCLFPIILEIMEELKWKSSK